MLSFSNPKNYRIYKVIFFTNLLKLDSNPHKQVDLDPQQKKNEEQQPYYISTPPVICQSSGSAIKRATGIGIHIEKCGSKSTLFIRAKK